ncbi:hypothetical protein, partial [Actinocrinis sp.]|uniref:hypothetical protein n=1 Tax=Actinocrinis sp. TaxID=1920516 RepID=UPI002D475C89
MTDTFLLTRAGITSDYITAAKAQQLYDDARARPESALDGDLETGFGFWLLSADGTVRLVRCTVTPCATPPPGAPV